MYACPASLASSNPAQAIEEDVKTNYAEALRLYLNALDYFMMALKCTYAAMTAHLPTHTQTKRIRR